MAPSAGAVAARDERRHPPPAGAPGWCESFTWELQPPGGDPAVTIRLVLHRDRAWYLAAVVAPGRPLTVVTDLEVPPPSGPSSLEIRTTGLWADHNVETPLAHVSVGLEAFGVTLDDPVDALTDGFGLRVPVGFDLEWEDDRPPVTGLGPDRYEAPGRAHGEILLGAERYDVDGPGSREHAWGPTDWGPPGWWRASIRGDDGRHTVARGRGGGPGTAVTVGSGGEAAPPVPAAVSVHRDDWGLPVAARLEVGDTTFALDAEACVPVPLRGPPAPSALLSVLVSCADPGGRGWLELAGPLTRRDDPEAARTAGSGQAPH
jgi:hypothetical protein